MPESSDALIAVVEERLKRDILPMFRPRSGFLRWSEANAYGVDAHHGVDELREAAASGGAALVLPYVQKAIASTKRVIMRADDSSGIIGDVVHRLLDVHAELATREGFVYMVRTPWLLGTLTFASLLIFLIMGPFEVLVPFVIKDVAGGGPEDHAVILAAFGIGGAVGSAVIGSLRLPRRYLTVMNLLWAFGCLPLAVFGLTDQFWVMAMAAFLVGAAFNGGVVIWGTLLQRRVPAAMLGRVSSLDFFVSLAFMPVSMAFAGPAGEALGPPVVFLIAGVAPLVIGVVAIIAARMTRDEVANPLDASSELSDDVSDEVAVDLPTLADVEATDLVAAAAA